MGRWVFYIPQVLVIAIVSVVYLNSVFKRGKQALHEEGMAPVEKDSNGPGEELRKEMESLRQEILTDGAMLVSFPVVVYTILLPGILGSRQLFSVINMIIAGSGMIAMVFLAVKILGRLKSRAELKRRYEEVFWGRASGEARR